MVWSTFITLSNNTSPSVQTAVCWRFQCCCSFIQSIFIFFHILMKMYLFLFLELTLCCLTPPVVSDTNPWWTWLWAACVNQWSSSSEHQTLLYQKYLLFYLRARWEDAAPLQLWSLLCWEAKRIFSKEKRRASGSTKSHTIVINSIKSHPKTSCMVSARVARSKKAFTTAEELILPSAVDVCRELLDVANSVKTMYWWHCD